MTDASPLTELLVVAGSRAYGMHQPTSDVDVRGVLVAPAAAYHGFAHHLEQLDSPGSLAAFEPLLTAEERAAVAASKLEGVVFEVRKFVSLAAECNPNLLDVVFCRDAEVRKETPLGRRLREHRRAFLSAKARHTYAGYAASQLKRIEGHRRWLLEPPKAPPRRADFGLPETTLLPADQLGAAAAAIQKQLDRWELDLAALPDATAQAVQQALGHTLAAIAAATGFGAPEDAKYVAAARTVGLGDDLVAALQRERAWEAASRHWRQYREWTEKRNPARAALEAAHGYDTKHAAHLVRLLRMGSEILRTGVVHVWRGPGGADDAHELLAIRRGEWRYEDLIAWTTAQDAELTTAAAASPLPRGPDREALDALCVALVEERLRGRSPAG